MIITTNVYQKYKINKNNITKITSKIISITININNKK